MIKHYRYLFIPLILLLLCSCSSSSRDITRASDFQMTDLSVDEEIKMTQEVLPSMQKDYPAYPDQILQKFISKIGQKIVMANNLDGNPYDYSFTVVNSKQINAFALPAGKIFVTTRLINIASSEAELAGVLGHEIAHVTNRHAAKRMYAEKKGVKKNILVGAIGAVGGGLAGFGIGKLVCPKGDKKCIRQASLGGIIVGGATGLLIRKYKFMKNSQRDEMQADRDGFKYAVNAGYSKNHIGNFYKKLLKIEVQHRRGNVLSSAFADAFSTHPPSRARVTQMNRLITVTRQHGQPVVTTQIWNEIKSRSQRE